MSGMPDATVENRQPPTAPPSVPLFLSHRNVSIPACFEGFFARMVV
jgi:hypothetical protein